MKYLMPLLCISLLLNCTTKEPTVYEWRGVDRKGIYPDTDLLKVWPDDGPEKVWSVEGIGNGFGSPVFAENHCYVTGEFEGNAVLQCIDSAGICLWRTTFGKEWMTSYPGSRSAPTIVGDLIYVGSGMGNLYCMDRESGEIRWHREFEKDFQGTYPLHGHSEAAVVCENSVLWTPGGKEFNVVALDRFSGTLLWNNPAFGEPSGYNPGKLIRLPDRDLFVTMSMYHILCLDIATGELLWSQEQVNYPVEKRGPGYGDSHANSALFESGSLFYVAGDGNGGVRLELSGDGSSFTESWRNKQFDSYMGGVVKLGNYLYGSGTHSQYLMAIDVTSGLLSDSLKAGQGAVISAEGMLYYYTQRGDMMLISQQDGKLKEISSFRISAGTGLHFSHPVIYKGLLYVRHGQTIMAFDIRRNQI